MKQALKASQDSDPRKQADIKVDSETERKPAKTGDVGRQNGTEQKMPSRSASHLTRG